MENAAYDKMGFEEVSSLAGSRPALCMNGGDEACIARSVRKKLLYNITAKCCIILCLRGVVKVTVVDRIADTVDMARRGNRVTLTDIARTGGWKQKLQDTGIIEITNQGNAYGYILTDDAMNALVDRLRELEDREEEQEIRRIVAERDQPGRVWSQGQDLADAAKRLLAEKASR